MSGEPGDRITVTARRLTPQAAAHPDDGELTLLVNNAALKGWKRVRVTRSVERIPADFDIEMSDVVPGDMAGVSCSPGDKCQVKLGDDLVLTGFVNIFAPTIDHGNHSIRVAGRSLSQDLVDCSAIWPHGLITNQNAFQIAQKLAQPFGLKVACAGDPGEVLPSYTVSHLDTGYSIIERGLRFASLLAYDLPDGSILMNQEGKGKASGAIKQGENVERATHTWNDSETFQKYNVYSLALVIMEDQGVGPNIVGHGSDPNVKRRREKFFVQEMNDARNSLAIKRAQWEAARRMGRAHKVQVRVDSWRDSAKKLWEPNTQVTVDLPAWRIANKAFVIGEVTYLRDETGTHADLTLMLPGSYSPQPILLVRVDPDLLPPTPGSPGNTNPPGVSKR